MNASTASPISLDMIRDCFEGAVPSSLATTSLGGVPNIVYISQVQYVDAEHIALTFQFFNKTHHNIRENPQAVLRVVNPFTGNSYRLRLRYLRTETSGGLFEKMRAKLAGIASHTGMTGVFKLLGSDIYKVESITALSNHTYDFKPLKPPRLPRLRQAAASIGQCEELGNLVDNCLALLADHFGITHAMFLVLDEAGERLFTCGSFGYEDSGIGSEILLGEGVVGVAAQEGTAIRISHMTSEYSYSNAIRKSTAALGQTLETAIPLPGLTDSRSQLALPLLNSGRTLGVIYVESEQDLAFDYDDEDMLETFAHLVSAQMQLVTANKPRELPIEVDAIDLGLMGSETHTELADESGQEPEDCPVGETESYGEPVNVRFFAADQSVFLNEDYLIKGVAGAIFWLLVQEYRVHGRTRFSNRELRLNPCLRLPGIADNLEARLTLLQKRLAEREACVQMHKCGRGRFNIQVNAPLNLLTA